jgi:hypothetical protein
VSTVELLLLLVLVALLLIYYKLDQLVRAVADTADATSQLHETTKELAKDAGEISAGIELLPDELAKRISGR